MRVMQYQGDDGRLHGACSIVFRIQLTPAKRASLPPAALACVADSDTLVLKVMTHFKDMVAPDPSASTYVLALLH